MKKRMVVLFMLVIMFGSFPVSASSFRGELGDSLVYTADTKVDLSILDKYPEFKITNGALSVTRHDSAGKVQKLTWIGFYFNNEAGVITVTPKDGMPVDFCSINKTTLQPDDSLEVFYQVNGTAAGEFVELDFKFPAKEFDFNTTIARLPVMIPTKIYEGRFGFTAGDPLYNLAIEKMKVKPADMHYSYLAVGSWVTHTTERMSFKEIDGYSYYVPLRKIADSFAYITEYNAKMDRVIVRSNVDDEGPRYVHPSLTYFGVYGERVDFSHPLKRIDGVTYIAVDDLEKFLGGSIGVGHDGTTNYYSANVYYK